MCITDDGARKRQTCGARFVKYDYRSYLLPKALVFHFIVTFYLALFFSFLASDPAAIRLFGMLFQFSHFSLFIC